MIKIFNKLSSGVAIVTILAITIWATGLPTWVGKVEAATLTEVSDTLSDSDLSVLANHTLSFKSPTGVPADDSTITITFPASFNMGSVGEGDIDIATTSDLTTSTDCTGSEQAGISVSGQVVTIQICNGDDGAIPATATTTIEIGTHAAGGANRITNPGSADSYEIVFAGTMTDTGATRVVIIDDVVVTASVDTSFTFTVAGVAADLAVNGDTTNEASTATTLPFGTLDSTASTTLAQDLTVTTNASNGFSVTVQQDQNLTSATGADIDLFIDGAGTAVPVAWQAPAGTLDTEDTYGHFGVTSEDSDLNSDEFGSRLYAGNFNAAREVFSHDGPSDGSTADKGATRVGFKIQIDALQEAGDDYTNVLTYVATPTF